MNKPDVLALTNGFPQVTESKYHCQFVYEITKLIAPYCRDITVVSPQPYMPTLLADLPISRPFSKLSGFHNYSLGNIQIKYPRYFTLPIDYFRHRNHERLEKVFTDYLPNRYDLIHVHFLNPTAYALLNSDFSHTPSILSLHGGDLYEWAMANRDVAALIMNKFSLLHVPTKRMAELISEIDKGLKEKVRIIPPSYDQNLFNPDKQIRKESRLLMVANLVRQKGIIDGIKTFEMLNATFNDLKLDIIGEGPYRSEIEKYIGEHKITGIRLIGAVKHDELPLYYQRSKLLLFPSYEESFGIVQIEAMACGTPVISYRNEGSKEIFSAHQDYLVDIGDINALTKKIRKLLENKTRTGDLSDIIRKYDHKTVSHKWEELYKELL